MPHYTLDCSSCHHRYEAICRWADLAAHPCPKCSATEPVVVPMPTNFTIKGYAASTGYTHKKA